MTVRQGAEADEWMGWLGAFLRRFRWLTTSAPTSAIEVTARDRSIAVGQMSGGIINQGAGDAQLQEIGVAIREDKTDAVIAALESGALDEAAAKRIAGALIERSRRQGGNTSSELASAYAVSFSELARADDPALRQAAVLEVRGDEEGAYNQLVAIAETGSRHAADRFRQAGALAALTSIDRAISAYSRAADLDPVHFWTWIELARLNRAKGSLPEAWRCANRAMQVADNERGPMLAGIELGDIAVEMGNLTEAKAHYAEGHAICSRLALLFPCYSDLQRNLSVSHDKLGDVAVGMGNLNEAKVHYADGLSIRSRLAATTPSNVEWQRDLSVSHNRHGDMMVAMGNLG